MHLTMLSNSTRIVDLHDRTKILSVIKKKESDYKMVKYTILASLAGKYRHNLLHLQTSFRTCMHVLFQIVYATNGI